MLLNMDKVGDYVESISDFFVLNFEGGGAYALIEKTCMRSINAC